MPAFGAATNLVNGTIILLPIAGIKYWFVQNQSDTAMTVTFPAGSGLGPIVLGAASANGGAGDWLDSVNFPWLGSITLTGATTAQFGSGGAQEEPER